MLSHYFTMALRFMYRNTGLTAINILGFTIGLAAGLMIYLWVDDELHFDDFHRHANHIYRVVQVDKQGAKTVYTSPALGDELQQNFPQIADHAFIRCSNDYDYFIWNDNLMNVWPTVVNKDFFSFFDFPFIEGNPMMAFDGEQTLVISEKFAKKLFGNEPALGKELLETSLYSDKRVPYRITGVVRLPYNTHISFDVARQVVDIRYDAGVTYLRFDEKATFNTLIQEALSHYMVDKKGGKNLLRFQPLKDIHLHTDFEYRHDHNRGNMQYVIVFSILAMIIVLMGAFNFMSLSTAQAIKRTKEVAVRKVHGGRKNELMGQFFTETLIQVFIAMFLALVLTEIFLPFLNNFTNKEIVMYFNFRFWITVFLSLVAVGLVAGSYPALYLSSFSPMLIFKGGNTTGRKTGFIRILVIVQFVLSIGLTICTLFVFRQLSYISNKDLGLDKDNIITFRCGLWYDVDEFKQEALRNPNVLSVCMSSLTPESFSFQVNEVTWEGMAIPDTVPMNMAFVDGDFAKTYGLRLVEGELMETQQANYWSGKGNPVMINESAARIMGKESPIGKLINGGRIVGVVRDFHFRPLKEPIVPLILSYNTEALVDVSIKLAPGNQQQTIDFIKKTYERMRPGGIFEHHFFDDKLAARYRTENELGRLFLIFTILSITISCLGILGLTAFSVEKRTKEIGLRKIAGASVMDIIWLLNRNYMRWIAIAFIIAVPIAALLMNRWLQGFVYHVSLSWWIFLLAGLITLVVAILTISWLCYKAANRNPVESLKYE